MSLSAEAVLKSEDEERAFKKQIFIIKDRVVGGGCSEENRAVTGKAA